MLSLSQATAEATARTLVFEEELRKNNEVAEKYEEQLRTIQKKMQSLEGQFDDCTEQVFEVGLKLEQKEKAYNSAESDVGGLTRRALLIEEEVERSEERLAKAVTELCVQFHRADKAIKTRQQLENQNTHNEEQGDSLDTQLKEERETMTESEARFEDIARKLATLEAESERSMERCTAGEKKISELEEELKLVGQNLQQLEVSEEKALQREEKYQKQIENLALSLKRAVNRDESATMNIQRLNIRIDQIEEDLLNEKLKIKKLSMKLIQPLMTCLM